ncbi:hypothetical protein [Haliangium ochraceum]|uniref:CheW protein n=1 Tax=Haliangium ochraceum (strain DSM 14365 / JCM 11303 / SMP-2) TaxID=502025 RepID=D0LUC6_HALO1|nr:hypothetical protein [Haliangium ochraceum]ACY19249.1 hypothetical protein Hoch_6785 [Haliangium ochraceum DSM 14365]
MSARAAIPVLGFRAGVLRVAIAAEDVTEVAFDQPDSVHIAEILGVKPAPPCAARRTIEVRALDERREHFEVASFVADPPVVLFACRREQIVPMPQIDLLSRWRPVMGFAKLDSGMHILLDLASVIRALHSQRRKGSA